MRVLIVEDDAAIAAIIEQGLRESGMETVVARDGEAGLRQALAQPFDLLILDILLPQLDGWSVCAELRERRVTTPILMLTARDAVEDRVRGLEIGADDYLAKPFDFRELLARVQALLRRDKVHRARMIRINDLEIDTSQRRASRAGVEIALTPREYSLLEALARNEGRVLTREMIQDRIWHDDDSYSNTVSVYINFLRRKIDANHAVKLIHTAHRQGYVLRGSGAQKSDSKA